MADYIWKLYKRTDISGLLNDSSLSDLDRKKCPKSSSIKGQHE